MPLAHQPDPRADQQMAPVMELVSKQTRGQKGADTLPNSLWTGNYLSCMFLHQSEGEFPSSQSTDCPVIQLHIRQELDPGHHNEGPQTRAVTDMSGLQAKMKVPHQLGSPTLQLYLHSPQVRHTRCSEENTKHTLENTPTISQRWQRPSHKADKISFLVEFFKYSTISALNLNKQRGWRKDSGVRRAGISCKGTESNSQHAYRGLQLSSTLVPGSNTIFWPLGVSGTHTHGAHIQRLNTHTHTI